MINPRSLMMPLSTSGHVRERIKGALAITAFFDGHLEVLRAQVSPREFIPEDVVGVPQPLIKELEMAVDKLSESESDELQAIFGRLCNEQGVSISSSSLENHPTAHWQEINGLRSELVAERGKVADLIIIPQSKSGKPTATFEAAILRSGKPVILVPRTMTNFAPNRIMIAWNGSTEGGRAVTQALPLLAQADEVVIATSTNSVHRKPGADLLIEYLARHDIVAISQTFNSKRRAAGEALLNLAEKRGSDLLVMGAFTHRRVHEQIFGGVTLHMIAHAKLPILMMH
ncbi:universal stress protein [Motiliproteus sp. MSK22-1]|uniref:universal stress protein n=1 Tax=Motiliproteus sp. MSK22-1 TaxID=1897630 RepID=UPI0009775828|nr:universal stress protein [Motiliproteus sp. MSK22-1]OMH27553.1 hypothetical protein BGP75_22540 [Motiliproteus sp. MSK22-1]